MLQEAHEKSTPSECLVTSAIPLELLHTFGDMREFLWKVRPDAIASSQDSPEGRLRMVEPEAR